MCIHNHTAAGVRTPQQQTLRLCKRLVHRARPANSLVMMMKESHHIKVILPCQKRPNTLGWRPRKAVDATLSATLSATWDPLSATWERMYRQQTSRSNACNPLHNSQITAADHWQKRTSSWPLGQLHRGP